VSGELSDQRKDVRPSRFVAAWLVAVVFVAGVLFPLGTLLFLTWSRGDISWVQSHYLCAERCLEARPASAGPRLLIFGGSASAFGIDAGMIEKRLGVPTVNFATHAGLGMDYQISRIQRYAKKGDAVLFCPEMEAYTESSVPTGFLREHIFSFEKAYVFSLEPKIMLKFLYLNEPRAYEAAYDRWTEVLTGRAEDRAETIQDDRYPVIKWDRNADFRGFVKEKAFSAESPPTEFNSHIQDSLDGFFKWCRAKGVRIMIGWPNIVNWPGSEKDDQFQLYAKVTQFCGDRGVPIIGTPKESLFPKELFVDTRYHLNEIGAKMRTQRLLPRLCEVLGTKAPATPKTICVMATRFSPGNEHDVFGKEAVEYKYLSETPLAYPDCITPNDLPKLAATGARVVCLDDATEMLAGEAGVRFKEAQRSEVTLADWIKKYDHHLFFFSLVGMDHCPVPGEKLPSNFAQLLKGDGYRIGLIGTGRWKKAFRQSRGDDKAEWRKRRFDTARMELPFEFCVNLRSGPASSYTAVSPPIVVEGDGIVDATPGLAVAVVDPYLGILEAHATFQGESLPLWKMRQMEAP